MVTVKRARFNRGLNSYLYSSTPFCIFYSVFFCSIFIMKDAYNKNNNDNITCERVHFFTMKHDEFFFVLYNTLLLLVYKKCIIIILKVSLFGEVFFSNTELTRNVYYPVKSKDKVRRNKASPF